MKRVFILLLLFVTVIACEDDCTQDALCTLVSSQDYGKSSDDDCDDDKSKITICHKGNTIEISCDSWEDHKKHGDTKGECETLSVDGLTFADGEIVSIDCGYELPFVHVTAAGTQWLYSKPLN